MTAQQPTDKRQKGMGHLFIRGNLWYMRYRYNGSETTRTTGVLVDDTDDITFAQSRDAANAVLMKETEIIRLQNKRSRLRIVKVMLESVDEEIKDVLLRISKESPLSCLSAAFVKSARRIDCSNAQLDTYQRYIREVVRHVGSGVAIASIDDFMAERIAETLALGRSPNTYNKYLNGLSVVWDAIGTRFGCADNPWRKLPRKHLDTHTRRDLTVDETDRILATADGEMRTLIAVGLYTGMRLGDCVNLTWGKIKDDVIYVKTGKTGANIALPLHANLKYALSAARSDAADDAYVLPELKRVYEASNSTLCRRVSALFKRCGISTKKTKDGFRSRPLCGFHSLRHTACSRWINAGVPPHIVQALLGHGSAKMTAHYTHLKDAQFLAAFQAMK